MKIINGELYLSLSEASSCGLGTENYLNKEKSRGAKWADFIKNPDDLRSTLLKYDTMAPNKKALVNQKFGNPYEYFAKEPIRLMVEKDTKAGAFYTQYTYGDDHKKLPLETIAKYTTAACWLNMLIKAQDDFKNLIKQTLNITAAKFWLTISEMIKTEGIDLPANTKRLYGKIKDYRANGYSCLIHPNFGNSNSKKIDDEVAEAVILELIAQPHTDDFKVCNQYNTWAAENNKPTISEATVGNWRRKFDYLINEQRRGSRVNYNKYGKHIKRFRPTAPLLLVEHDDNELDLFFRSSTKAYYFNRFVLCVVIDAFNDYPLGWAIGESYNKELIRFAYLDAVHHIKQLTGAYYLPHQIRCDRFGLDANAENDLGQFYKSLATFTPAAVKVPRGKYIERSFGTKWHQVLSCYKNYAGANITSQKRANQDHIELHKKDYPPAEQAPDQAHHFINILRHLVDEKTGLSKQEQWVAAFNASDKSKKHLITDLQLLIKLGTPHAYKNTITARGITPAINCAERTYEIPEKYYLQTVGKKVQVIYDHMDYSRILVTDYQSILFIAHEQELMPAALADYKPGDRAKINDRLEEKRRHMQAISSKKDSRVDTLRSNQINIESLIMAGIHTKAENHGIQLNYSPVPIAREQKVIKEKVAAASGEDRTLLAQLQKM